ncbi:hypothetical protein [uncultured Ruegeria sp.]|uniref:hypothetical protein n=1 Tax=uncultured Ruegeria sp. TaxID=259304 RepID=UPI002615C9D2|nr:hypothetical protein [uncultured Ruegeria sp.]
MTIRKIALDGRRRDKTSSPDRPNTTHREQHVMFWCSIRRGFSSEEAAVQVGTSAPVGSR